MPRHLAQPPTVTGDVDCHGSVSRLDGRGTCAAGGRQDGFSGAAAPGIRPLVRQSAPDLSAGCCGRVSMRVAWPGGDVDAMGKVAARAPVAVASCRARGAAARFLGGATCELLLEPRPHSLRFWESRTPKHVTSSLHCKRREAPSFIVGTTANVRMPSCAIMRPSPGTAEGTASASPAPSAAALSVNQLTRLHCRERLLVAPLFWTSRHLELLQCSFGDPSPAPPTARSDFTGPGSGLRFIRRMFAVWKVCTRENGMRNILAYSDCPLYHLSAPPQTPFSQALSNHAVSL